VTDILLNVSSTYSQRLSTHFPRVPSSSRKPIRSWVLSKKKKNNYNVTKYNIKYIILCDIQNPRFVLKWPVRFFNRLKQQYLYWNYSCVFLLWTHAVYYHMRTCCVYCTYYYTIWSKLILIRNTNSTTSTIEVKDILGYWQRFATDTQELCERQRQYPIASVPWKPLKIV